MVASIEVESAAEVSIGDEPPDVGDADEEQVSASLGKSAVDTAD